MTRIMRRFYFLKSCIALMAMMLVLPSGAMAQEGSTLETAEPSVAAILKHPSVVSARARICTASSQYSQARSRQLPQMDVSLQGASSLSNHIVKTETERRRLQDRAIDVVIGADQVLFDWGVTESDKQIALNDKSAARIAMTLEIDRIAADIIDISFTVAEHRARFELYDDYIGELKKLVEQIEALVNAGVLRIGDLRAIKVIELDAEIARALAERQRDLAETELNSRFGLSFEEANFLLNRFFASRPSIPPSLDSDLTREVKRIDHQIRSSQIEGFKLKAELRPRLSTSLDLTFFDADGQFDEYELTGTMRLNLPLYDGGNNRARQGEVGWQQRGLESERANIIRQHSNLTASTLQNIEQARETKAANDDKLVEVENRLNESLARQGQTTSASIDVARAREQLVNVRSEQIGLEFEIELGLLQGLFFADELGRVLELPYGGPQC